MRPDEKTEGPGLIQLYYGNGKGKTTAAVGQMVRAAGFGFQVLFYQFMKDNSSSERRILEKLPGITCLKGPAEVKFSFRMTPEEKQACLEENEKKLKEIAKLLHEAAFDQTVRDPGGYDMVVLDEAVYAVSAGLLKEDSLISFLKGKPEHTEVLITGNPPGEKLLACADYATEMRMEKHPFTRGIMARDGIER